jgi:hypothetical protein
LHRSDSKIMPLTATAGENLALRCGPVTKKQISAKLVQKSWKLLQSPKSLFTRKGLFSNF